MAEDEFSKLEERAKIAFHADIAPRDLVRVVAQGALRLIEIARRARDAGPPVERATNPPMTEADVAAIERTGDPECEDAPACFADVVRLIDEIRRLNGELGREQTKAADWRRAAKIQEARAAQAEQELERLDQPWLAPSPEELLQLRFIRDGVKHAAGTALAAWPENPIAAEWKERIDAGLAVITRLLGEHEIQDGPSVPGVPGFER